MSQTLPFLTGFQSQTSETFRTRQKLSAIWKNELVGHVLCCHCLPTGAPLHPRARGGLASAIQVPIEGLSPVEAVILPLLLDDEAYCCRRVATPPASWFARPSWTADVGTLACLGHALTCLVIDCNPQLAIPPRSSTDPPHLDHVAWQVQHLLSIPGLSIQHATCLELRRQTIRAASFCGAPAVGRADTLSGSSVHRFCAASNGRRLGSCSHTDEEGDASTDGDASFEEVNLSSERDLSRSSVRQDNDPSVGP